MNATFISRVKKLSAVACALTLLAAGQGHAGNNAAINPYGSDPDASVAVVDAVNRDHPVQGVSNSGSTSLLQYHQDASGALLDAVDRVSPVAGAGNRTGASTYTQYTQDASTALVDAIDRGEQIG